MRKYISLNIGFFFLSVLSLWGQSTKNISMEHRKIWFTVVNQCMWPDSLLRQEVIITNQSAHNVWLSIDHLGSSFFSVDRIRATYTTIGSLSGRPDFGYLPPLYILLTKLKPITDTTVIIDTDIPYRLFQIAPLTINIDFIEDSDSLHSHIQTYQIEGISRIGIPYEEYEDRVIRYSMTVFP